MTANSISSQMAAHRLIWRFSNNIPTLKCTQQPLSNSRSSSYPIVFNREMTFPLKVKTLATLTSGNNRKMPIFLFDILDTIVRDPFYHMVPSFFGMNMKELLECKNPTAWIDFEKGLINEMELARIFFKDGRPVDLEGLKSCMRQGYSYIEGVEELLDDLKQNGYEMHASTNYPIWYEMIEEKLKLSTYLSWTFCSCSMGKRKPDPDFYVYILNHLKVDPTCCIFVDDRMRNVEVAIDAGLIGIQFTDVKSLRNDLAALGVDIQSKKCNKNSGFAE